jgi:hypothetical protein
MWLNTENGREYVSYDGYWVEVGASASSPNFTTISTPAGTSPVADVAADTLTLTSGSTNLTITGNSTTDTIDFDIVDPPTFTGVTVNGTLAVGTTAPTRNGTAVKLPVIVQRVACTATYTTTTSTAVITGCTATVTLQTGDLVVFFGAIDANASGATGTLACTLYAAGSPLGGASAFAAGAATDRLTLGFHPEYYTAASNGSVTFDMRAIHTNSAFTIRTNTSFTMVVYR